MHAGRIVPRTKGRHLFGQNPAQYDRARFGYPERVYDILRSRCGLSRTSAVFEIGPGTGVATRRLLRLGNGPYTVIEPDRRLARYLISRLGSRARRVALVTETFERARLPRGAFDLGVAATSFHWVPERPGLRKVAWALRPGGWWAMWGNRHGDPARRSPFDEALDPLYREFFRRANPRAQGSWATEREPRLAALEAVGLFEKISSQPIRWTVKVGSRRLVTLWGTFSEVVTLSPRRRRVFLTTLRRIVDDQFGGRVEIRMLTPMFTARRIEERSILPDPG